VIVLGVPGTTVGVLPAKVVAVAVTVTVVPGVIVAAGVVVAVDVIASSSRKSIDGFIHH